MLYVTVSNGVAIFYYVLPDLWMTSGFDTTGCMVRCKCILSSQSLTTETKPTLHLFQPNFAQ